MQWGKDSGQNMGMVLLDIEKSYDRNEWHFLIKVLERLGFPLSFCKWVDILFKYSTTVIDVNEGIYDFISLGRSIRQGPLSAFSLCACCIRSNLYS